MLVSKWLLIFPLNVSFEYIVGIRYIIFLLNCLLRYTEALEVLDSIVKRDETNAAPRKRKVAILKARGKTTEAIKELTDYLKM